MRKDLSHLENLRLAQESDAAAAIDVELGAVPGQADGRYLVKVSAGVALQLMASELHGWDQVSVVAKELDHRGRDTDAKRVRAPSYWEMLHVRRMFWEDWEPVQVELPPPHADVHGKIAYLRRPQPGTEVDYGPQGEKTPLTPGQAERYKETYAKHADSQD